MKTTGNTILITGGASGIGLAMAKQFVQLNNQVIITGRDAQKLAEAKQLLPQVYTYSCDSTSQSQLDDLVLNIENHHPQLNVLINNAGVQFNYMFLKEHSVAGKIDCEIITNLSVPIKLTALLLPILCTHAESAVINVSSSLAFSPKKTASVYCATKAAIHSFSKTLRYQLEREGVKVFEIVPPLVDTPMTEGRSGFKITADDLVTAFIKCFEANKLECYVGRARILKLMRRIVPTLAERIMKNAG